MTEELKIVAWMVTDILDDYSTIVFHHHPMAARRLGAEELDRDFDEVECCRAPAFDDGDTSVTRKLEEGWRFLCMTCETVVSGDDDDIVVNGEKVYCCLACADNDT